MGYFHPECAIGFQIHFRSVEQMTPGQTLGRDFYHFLVQSSSSPSAYRPNSYHFWGIHYEAGGCSNTEHA